MKKMYKNRYYIAFISSLCVFFLAIVVLHSYQNLKDIIKPASENWGRASTLGATDLYKKQPSVVVDDKYANILMANKTNFTHVKLDRATRQTEEETFSIKGVESYKVQKFVWDIENIYFQESGSLYYSTKNPNGGYSAKMKITEEIVDFELVNNSEKATIAVAHKDGIALYQKSENGFSQISEKYSIEKLSNVAAIRDNQNLIHIAAYSEIGTIDFPIFYLTFDKSQFKLIGSVTERTMSETWGINNIDIGLDDTDAYIFYEMVKWDKTGTSAKTLYATVPLNQETADLKFNKFYLFESEKQDATTYINEPRIIKEQGNEIEFSVIKDSADKKKGAGFSGYSVTMDNGKLTSVIPATRNQRLLTNTTYLSYKGDDIFVYMDAAGGFNYETFYVETGSAYNANSVLATEDDYYVAIVDTIPGYVSSFLMTCVKFTIQFPLILWFLVIEFLEIKKMKDRPKLTMAIGLVLYVIVKVITFGPYYTPVSMSQMPPLLLFTGAKYVFSIGFAVISFFIVRLLKKHNPELHLISEFIIYALIDIEFTNLLYTTYMV